MPAHAVHPLVSGPKFEREIGQLRDQESRMREHGVLLLDVTAPTLLIAFATPQLQPAGIVVAAEFDYTDFDLRPPSIKFVNPFTRERLRHDQMLTHMKRSVEQQIQIPGAVQALPDGSQMPATMVAVQDLVQAHDGAWPFLCLPGVREYHAHPGHSGDPWELHRTSGAGNLVRLVETIRKYAVEPVTDWAIQLIPHVGGFAQGQPPA